MTLNDERLRLAYKEALAARAAGGHRVSCPEPEALLAVAERAGTEAMRLEVLDHALACDRCRHELDLMRASLVAAGVPKARTWLRSPSVGLIAIAALLLLAAGVRMFMASNDPDAGSRLRGGAGVVTYPVVPVAGGAGLAWRPIADALSYRVELLDNAGAAVVDSTVRDTTLFVPASVAAGRDGLVWTVSATLGDGTSVSSLPIPVRISPATR